MKTFILVMAAFCLTAGALTLKEKKTMEDWMLTVNDPSKGYLQKIKRDCGIDIKVKLDEKAVAPFIAASADMGALCSAVVSEIANLCGRTPSRAEVVKRLKSISCMIGSGQQAAFKISGSELQAKLAPTSSNVGSDAHNFLERGL